MNPACVIDHAEVNVNVEPGFPQSAAGNSSHTAELEAIHESSQPAESGPPSRPRRRGLRSRKRLVWVVCAVLGLVAAVALYLRTPATETRDELPPKPSTASPSGPEGPALVDMPHHQQEAVGLKVARAEAVTAFDTTAAPGRIAADQEHFAFITARAPGVVRSVAVNIGQEVRAGDVLATIDSPEVGRARLELRSQLQLLEVAQAQATWQAEVHANTRELIAGLKRGDEPDTIQKKLEGRPVGAGRDRLMSAYAQYRLASAALERNKSLVEGHAVSMSQFQQARAAYEAASGSYQALLDSTEYEARLADLRAQQAERQAETAVGVSRERLKILGVGLEDVPPAESALSAGEAPLSTYTLVAPFDGTILDRTLIVPGVSVGLTERLFTISNLSTVWLEVNVSEGGFGALARAAEGEVRFESPAYPGRTFTGRVIYRGDLVDEASRSVKLLAVAANPDRLLKPGMFVDVTVCCPGTHAAARVPDTGVLATDGASVVFVRTGPERFERREVVPGGSTEGNVDIVSGLGAGEEVVVEGASKLEALTDVVAVGRGG